MLLVLPENGSPEMSGLRAQCKKFARHSRDRFFPNAATREYRRWIAQRQTIRLGRYHPKPEPGLLSVITAVWDGSPVDYLLDLAQSLRPQLSAVSAQWVVTANGCRRPQLVAALRQLAREQSIHMEWSEQNLGIVGGLRLCLESASGRYVLPVDADDRLYPDTLAIVTAALQQHGYPPLLYTDEDKLAGHRLEQPYCKPDWDPVLLANSAYIAHLGVINRQLALDLNAYGSRETEGSADWDVFTRFARAGHAAVHIPEILYSWRIHGESTADDAGVKPYIVSSQRSVLAAYTEDGRFEVRDSELFGPASAHFRVARSPNAPLPSVAHHRVSDLAALRTAAHANGCEYFALMPPASDDVTWIPEAVGLFERFPDTLMVGGRMSSAAGTLLDGARVLGFGGVCGCPDAGRKTTDPGYFGGAWKQRSVSAVPAFPSLLRTAELRRLLDILPGEATLAHLGCWAGAEARRVGRRIVYSPFLHHVATSTSAIPAMTPEETETFLSRYAGQIPDRRFYPEPFSLERPYRIDLS